MLKKKLVETKKDNFQCRVDDYYQEPTNENVLIIYFILLTGVLAGIGIAIYLLLKGQGLI